MANIGYFGRDDGRHDWMGQIAPISSHGEQSNGGGRGNRYKVRIFGQHPPNEVDINNDNLPWAIASLPTTAGTGAANCAVNTKLRPGDIVHGHFLDGENGRIPIIDGSLGRTSEIKSFKQYQGPFIPFTGYDDRVPPPNGTLNSDETNEQRSTSQQSPWSISKATAKRINQIAYSEAIGLLITPANTCDDTAVKGIGVEVNNLLNKIQNASNVFLNIPGEINRSVEKIQALANGFVGQMMNTLYNKLTSLLKDGLDLLYKTVYAATLAATSGNVAAAHLEGVKAQEAMVPPVKILEESIPCVAGTIVNGLGSVVKELLTGVVNNVTNFVTCAANQFTGAFLNTIIDSIVTELSSALNGVSKILSPAFKVAEFLRSGVDSIKAIGGLFDCNQSKIKCSGKVNKITIGKGPNDTGNDNDTFDKILAGMNISSAVDNLGSDFQQKYGQWDIFGDGTKVADAPLSPLGGCYTGPPTSCGSPVCNIFGGGGSGASAIPLLGSIVSETGSIIGVNVLNGGSGYRYPPFVEFVDSCNQGYGAIGRSIINDAGEVTAIYIVSEGENYPIGDTDPYGVTDVVIQDPGNGYSTGDTGTDNLGNTYDLTIDNGRVIAAKPINTKVITDLPLITINSNTGIGARLRPILGTLPEYQGEVKQVIDCVT